MKMSRRGFIARSVVVGVLMLALTKPIPSCVAAQGIAECSRIFEAEISDGVIHGEAVIAGGLDGDEVSASWGWADAAHTVPMTTRTVIDVASATKAALRRGIPFASRRRRLRFAAFYSFTETVA